MSFIPTTLYYAAAAIHTVSIPGHIMFGINEVDPAIAQIPADQEHAVGKATATTAWDMVNGLLAASGKLSFILYFVLWPASDAQLSTAQRPMVKNWSSNSGGEGNYLDHRCGRNMDRLEVFQSAILCWVGLLVGCSLAYRRGYDLSTT